MDKNKKKQKKDKKDKTILDMDDEYDSEADDDYVPDAK